MGDRLGPTPGDWIEDVGPDPLGLGLAAELVSASDGTANRIVAVRVAAYDVRRASALFVPPLSGQSFYILPDEQQRDSERHSVGDGTV